MDCALTSTRLVLGPGAFFGDPLVAMDFFLIQAFHDLARFLGGGRQMEPFAPSTRSRTGGAAETKQEPVTAAVRATMRAPGMDVGAPLSLAVFDILMERKAPGCLTCHAMEEQAGVSS